MSYILDALRKIEEEKAKKSKKGVSLSGEFLRKESSAKSRFPYKIVLITLSSVLFVSLLVWGVIKLTSTEKVDNKKVVETEPVQKTTEPKKEELQNIPPKPERKAEPQVVPEKPQIKPEPQIAVKPQFTREKGELPQIKKVKPMQNTISPPANIKVSGIAWQESKAARRAVINGVLMQEGTTVSGAKIVSIQEDRVKFSTANGQFEIPVESN